MKEEQQSLTTKSCLQANNVSALICELTDMNVCVLAATQRRWLE